MVLAAMACIFAGKYLWSLAVVGVVAQTMGEEPLLITVIVLVIEIDFELLHAWLQEIEVPALRVRTSGTDEFQIRILRTQGIREFLQTGGEHRTEAAMGIVVVPLLITHTKELQVEGCRVPHLGTHLSPLRIDGTIGKLYEVESILDVAVE